MESRIISSRQHQASSSAGHQSVTADTGCEHRILLEQVEKVLQSEEFKGSEVLRRLLRYLAEKSACGEADDLKEYIVAIEGLGKPASYNPRYNSTVRIQLRRLREKLAAYYGREGQQDSIILEIPKGRYKLKCSLRHAIAGQFPLEPLNCETPTRQRRTISQWLSVMRIPVSMVAGILLVLVSSAIYNGFVATPAKATTAVIGRSAWSTEMEELWQPFITTSRPTIVAIEDPLFIELDGKRGLYCRDKKLNIWNDVANSPDVSAIRTATQNHAIAPSHYYTTLGEVHASFLLGELLGSRVQNLSVLKSSDLSPRQFAENNTIFVGMENVFFASQIRSIPIDPPLQPVVHGIRNAHPAANEPAVFLDQYSEIPRAQGVLYALVTHLPGPQGDNDVESFTSSRAAGYYAAVKAYTDPDFVRSLVHELQRAGNGHMPRYYQVLLKIKFTAEQPTEVKYVLARALKNSASTR